MPTSMVSMKEALCMPADCDGAMEIRRGLDLESEKRSLTFKASSNVSMT